MLEQAIQYIQHLSPIGILLFAMFITFAENIFPPSPSDMLLVFCGTLVGVGTVNFIPLALFATLGSTLGFALMYYFGYKFEVKAVEGHKLKFVSEESIYKVEGWFRKYGYWLIVANRFLSGTRAVISFFAGMSKLNFKITLALSAVSALIWNCILIYGGMVVGRNWRKIGDYLSTYGTVTGIILGVVAIIFLVRWFIKRKQKTA